MSLSVEVDKQTSSDSLSSPEGHSINNELVVWNGLLKRFFDRKREEKKLAANKLDGRRFAGSRIENAFGIYEANDPEGRVVEFVTSSTSNKFKNMVTIHPITGTEGPEEVFLWSAGNPTGLTSNFSEPRFARLKQAMDLIDDPSKDAQNG